MVFLDNGTSIGTGTVGQRSERIQWTGQLPLGTDSITAELRRRRRLHRRRFGAFLAERRRRPDPQDLGASAALPSDGTWSSNIYFAATSDPTNIDYPHTRFSVALSGISGLTASNLRLQQDTGSGFANVPLTDSSARRLGRQCLGSTPLSHRVGPGA